MERVAMLFLAVRSWRLPKDCCGSRSRVSGVICHPWKWSKDFLCVCVVFLLVFWKGVVVFLLVTGLVSYEGDFSGIGGGATPTDGGCSKEPLGVMNVAGVMEARGVVYVHSSKGYCGSTRTGPRALHQLVRSKNSNTCCLYFLLLLKLLQRGLAPISQGKYGSPPMKVKLTELSISDLRHALTLN